MFNRLIGFILVASTAILGSTYYIDYATGSNGNPGTSKSAPWKLSPGMNGFSATYSHISGDVYIFKGGVTWPAAALPFTIANSGAAGKTDTYTTDHTWYTGSTWTQPTLDGQFFQQTLLSASDKSYVLMNDLRLINAGALSANDVMAFQFINCSYFELSNNTFAPESWGCLYVSTERTGDYNTFLVHHNDISRCAFAMRFVPAAPASIMYNVQVYNNTIHDFHSQLSGEVHGDGLQHYCSPDNATSYDRYIEGFKIFNNHFFGDFSQVAGSRGAMTALIYLSGSSKGVQIYNNIFAPQYSGSQSPNFFESFISLRDNPNRGGYHKIYNNTFVTPVADGQAAAILEDDTRYPAPFLDIKNNIFSNFNWPFDLRSTNHTIDYNDDYFIRDIGKWAGNFIGSFSSWQALGLDVHGLSANPGFVSSTDLHLSQTSPCIGKGTNLSTVVTTDIDGNARPGSSGFSLGAYEFGTTPPPPPPVTLSAPELWWPGNGATGVVIDPSLTWSAVSGAATYSVQASTSSSFATTIINQGGIAETSFDANGLLNNTAYYWRVRAANATGTGSWSSTGNFTTVAAAPPPPVDLSAPELWWPGNGATGVVIDPSLTWSAVSGAATYSVQASTSSSFATTIINQGGIAETSFDANGLLNNTAYYWRVSAANATGTGSWSSTGNFTTTATQNNAFLQNSGKNGIVSIDAEHFMDAIVQGGHTWERVSSTGYSGDGAMQALPNNGASINTGYAANSPRMDYMVTFVKTGRHYIWVRGIGPSGSDDSYHAGLDNKEIGTCDQITNFTTAWKWSRTDGTGTKAYFKVPAAGNHTVNIWMREDGFIIDKIVITINRNYVPSGTGPAESQRSVLAREAVQVPAEKTQIVPYVLDIYSFQNGSVRFSIPFSGRFELSIYAVNGQKVGHIVESAGSAGLNTVPIGKSRMPQGVYVMRLTSHGASIHRKIVVMK